MHFWSVLDAVQAFEYGISHIVDKAAESIAGYCPVLPGAFSIYRWMAIRGSPMHEYFRLEETRMRDLSPFVANQYLAGA